MITFVSARNLLGYAGLLPFVIPVFLVALGSSHQDWLLALCQAYAFGIICFLTGSWWGLALKPETPTLLWLSNLYFLIGMVLYFFVPEWWSMTAAILLACIYLTEQVNAFSRILPQNYRQMRSILTLVAGISMLSLQLVA